MGKMDRNLTHSITRWTVSESLYDGFDYGPPQLIKGRWQERSVMFRSPDGEELVSQAIVYLAEDVNIGDFLALGDYSTSASPPSGAARVRQFNRISNLRDSTIERKAFL
jgi:hypothetical protein